MSDLDAETRDCIRGGTTMTNSTLEVFTRNPDGTTAMKVDGYDKTHDAFADGYGIIDAADPALVTVRVRTGNVFTDLFRDGRPV